METYSEKTGSKVNELLARTIDAKKGYEMACENVKDVLLKSYFDKKVTEREMFADQLKAVIGSLGEDATETEGSMQGSAHRVWMDLKTTFSVDSNEAILEEAIRGEKKAVEDYKEVLNETYLSAQAKNIIESQLSMIQNSLATVKSLEEIN